MELNATSVLQTLSSNSGSANDVSMQKAINVEISKNIWLYLLKRTISFRSKHKMLHTVLAAAIMTHRK